MAGKEEIRIKFGLALQKALAERDLSFRQFAIVADMEYAHVQRIATGKVNLEFSTFIHICEGLGIAPQEMMNYYTQQEKK